MTKTKLSAFYFLLFTFIFCLSAFSQTLSVREIMREPSIAGMRAESEKLSPDGKTVIFSWNAAGIEPRNLYIVSTSGGEPRILVNAEENFEMRSPQAESKLNYGLTVRDDFVKAREKNLFGVEFSPDSKRILFLQNTDIYVLDLAESKISSNTDKELIKKSWTNFESVLNRLIDLLPQLFEKSNAKELEIWGQIADGRYKVLTAIKETAKEANGDKSFEQKRNIYELSRNLGNLLENLRGLAATDSRLKNNEPFLLVLDEISGVENRLNVARLDYNDITNAPLSSNKPRRITRTQGFEGAARWLTNDSILYSSGGNYFVLNLAETSLVQVTKEANPAAFQTVFGVNPTKDATLLAELFG
jgi:hypothetical protein